MKKAVKRKKTRNSSNIGSSALETSLHKRHFVATDADISELAVEHMAATVSQSSLNQNFLRALIGTTISELGAEARDKTPKERAKLETAAAIRQQLEAMEKVFDRFYRILFKSYLEGPTDPDSLPRSLGADASKKDIAHSRCTKFRSAKSTIKAWMRLGHDITLVAPASITRYALESDIRDAREQLSSATPIPEAVGVARYARRAETAASRMVKAVQEIARYDAVRANELIAEATAALAQMRAAVSGKDLSVTTTSLKKAVERGQPLSVDGEMFVVLPYHPAGEAKAAAAAAA